MKLKHTLSFFAVWLALATAAFGQAAPSSAPKLAIKETNHNVGDVKKGVSANFSFVFKNEGSADLEIKRVAPS
ncbi:MAG: DUF1573 domain-containing protein [Acidobacteria bacterium]|nr:DUF1573 domain-containing protein [Acidobacteriota bacterium]